MAVQGTTEDLMLLLAEMKKEGKEYVVHESQVLFLFDPPGSYQKAIGIVLDIPGYNTGGGMDAFVD